MKSLASIPKELVNLLHVGEPFKRKGSGPLLLFGKAASILRTRRASFFSWPVPRWRGKPWRELPARYDALRSFSNKRLHPTAPVC
jgi:hypothetical protein